MSEDNNSIEIQQEAKEIIMKELERKGVINYMRAKIKKSIIDIIGNQKESFKQKLDFDYMTPLHRLNKPKEIVLVCQLIKEFLKFYELEYTLPIFENESNIKENIKRETLLKELKLEDKKDLSKPILLLLLQDKLNRKDDIINNQKNIDRYDNYNKSEGELSNIEVNKNQLNPTSFGSTDKSLDMNINKYNTFNINEVYKNENKSINENNKIININKDKIINENIKENKINELNKEEFKDEINEEINEKEIKEIKEKEESKNIESQTEYESTSSNK